MVTSHRPPEPVTAPDIRATPKQALEAKHLAVTQRSVATQSPGPETLPQTLNRAPISLIIPAAGQSTRFGGAVRKVFRPLGGRVMFLQTLGRFLPRQDIRQILLAFPADDLESIRSDYAIHLSEERIELLAGGRRRCDTVAGAIEAVDDRAALILIHDAARPFVDQALIDRVIQAASESGAAVPGVPLQDTLKRGDKQGRVLETIDRHQLHRIQTPQAFDVALLRRAVGAWDRRTEVTDDAQWVELLGEPVRLVAGSGHNFKITTAEDLALAEAMLSLGAWSGQPAGSGS